MHADPAGRPRAPSRVYGPGDLVSGTDFLTVHGRDVAEFGEDDVLVVALVELLPKRSGEGRVNYGGDKNIERASSPRAR